MLDLKVYICVSSQFIISVNKLCVIVGGGEEVAVVEHTWSSEKSFGPAKREGRNKFLCPVVARKISSESVSLE